MQDINIWKKYYTLADEERNIEDIPIEHLHMSRFFMDRKKKDDDRYEPTTLTSFHRSLQGYLNDHASTLLMPLKTGSLACPERPFTREGGSYYEILEMEIGF